MRTVRSGRAGGRAGGQLREIMTSSLRAGLLQQDLLRQSSGPDDGGSLYPPDAQASVAVNIGGTAVHVRRLRGCQLSAVCVV